MGSGSQQNKEDTGLLNMFNTPLTLSEEKSFQDFLAKQSQALGRDVSKDLYDYDARGFFKAGENIDERGHGSDRFKKPNHPTFSTESKWASEARPGGQWTTAEGQSYFQPSDYMIEKQFGGDVQKAADFYVNRYFPRADKDVKPILKPVVLRR